ncbi:MAG: NAD-dependent epimerase/dehydratase family protein [Phototrophicaceae bacterium]
MKLLFIGGTEFVGRAMVAAALGAGHEVTLFHRGRTNPDLFPAAERIQGDRETDLDRLDGRTWDAVIDTCGYLPHQVELSTAKLAGAVGLYAFISTISVYAESVYSTPGTNEDGPLAELKTEPPQTIQEISGETYGPLKVRCEQIVEAVMPGRALIIRPGLIVGPHDMTDRFTYWPVRIARGGEAAAPPLDSLTQFIDVRDLGNWTVRMVEQGATGPFNATGPDYPLNFGVLLETCREVAGSDAAHLVAMDEVFLREQEVRPWQDLPLYMPQDQSGLVRLDVSRAISAGLTFRPLVETVRDTLRWFKNERSADPQLRVGLSSEREAAVLAAWKARQAD